MTVTKNQISKSNVAGARPAPGTRKPGEMFVNFADKQLSTIKLDATILDLLSIPFHSSTASYVVGDLVVFNDQIYQATTPSTAVTFTASMWKTVGADAAIISTSAPSVTPLNVGTFWWNPTTGLLSILYLNGAVKEWRSVSVPPVLISDTAPASPFVGQLWWESDTGQMYLWYDDGNSQQWVQASGSTGSPGIGEAPVDGQRYLRRDGGWEILPDDSTALPENLFTNPAMQVSQQNGLAGSTANDYYPADEWIKYHNLSTGVISIARVLSTTPRGSSYRLRATVTTLQASMAAANFVAIETKVEGFNWADQEWGTADAKDCVVRFGFRGPAGTYGVSLSNGDINRSYVTSFTVAAPDANTDIEVELAIPGDVTGTWDFDELIGVMMDICLACGTTGQGVAGWQAGAKFTTASQSNGMAVNGAVFEVFDAGLYKDPDSTGRAPAWELPNYSDVLNRCQRYYRKYKSVGPSAAIGGASGVFVSATSIRVVMSFAPPMRVFPVAAFSAATDFQFVGVSAFTASAISALTASPNVDCLVIEATVAGATAGQGCYMRSANSNATFALNARM